MSDSTDVLSAARKLAPSERLDLVERLLDSLDQPDGAVDALWAKEAQDRLSAYRRGEIASVPLPAALAKYAAR